MSRPLDGSQSAQEDEASKNETGISQSAELYLQLFKRAPVGLGLAAADGRLIQFNDAMLKPGGYLRADIDKLKGVEQFYSDPGERDKIVQILRRDGAVRQYELRFKRKDGTSFDAALSVSSVNIGDERYHLAVVEDITDRKRAEKALQASETRFRALIENSAEVITLFAADGTVQYVSPSVERVLGYAPEELIGRPGGEIVHPDDQELANAQLARGLQQPGVVHRFEDIRLLHKDGAYRTVQVTGQNLLHVPSVAALVSNFRDVTEQRRTERELRKSEADYRALFERAPLGLYRSTVEGAFVRTNQALVEMLGYDSEKELLGIDLATDLYLNPEERAQLIALTHGRDVLPPREVQWKRKDGRIIIVRLTGRKLYEPGNKLAGFEMMAEDVTRQKALEDQLRHSQKMDAVGQLTGGIAHDFNNLLTTIIGNAQLIQEGLDQDQASLRDNVDQILLAARRGADMNAKLLAFSRKERLRFDALDLSQLCRETSHMLRRILPENVEVRVVSSLRGQMVRADRGAVQQMLVNLCTNARDAMPRGGVLTIATTPFHADRDFRALRERVEEDYVCLSVSDTGQGMTEETRRRIFEPFFTTKDRGRGTGLGMSMVYGLARQHHGFVEVVSAIGKGTKITAYFPELTGQ